MPVSSGMLNLTKKEMASARRICRRTAAESMWRTKFHLLNDCDEPISDTYLQKRKKILNSFSELGVQEVALEEIKSAKTLKELLDSIIYFPKALVAKTFPKFPESLFKKRSIPLQVEQEAYKYRNLRAACVREINTVFSKKSTNQEVIKIENILKEKYGVKVALLNDDMVVAKRVLEAVKLAKSKSVRIPDEFIVTNFTLGNGECLRLFKDGEEINTVLLPNTHVRNLRMSAKDSTSEKMPMYYKQILDRWKKFCGFKEQGSTSSPLHMEIHEIMHQTHIPLTPFLIKKNPVKIVTCCQKNIWLRSCK